MMRVLKYWWFHSVMILTGWLPDNKPFIRLRGWLARPAFKRCGPRLEIARNTHIGFPSNLEIGRDVFIGYGTWIQAGGGVTIEDEVLLAPYVVLIAGDHGMQDGSYRFGHGTRAPIRLRKGCWIGAHVTVTKGVTVGKGALVAANAAATKDLPDFCIAGGTPARVLKQHKADQEATS